MIDLWWKGVVPVLTTKCVVCGHKVRDSDLPIGRVCLRRIQRADLSDAKPFQVQKAMDLIVDQGIARLDPRRLRNPVFRCTSSDGTRVYTVAPMACSCPAGQAGRVCYHRVAVRML